MTRLYDYEDVEAGLSDGEGGMVCAICGGEVVWGYETVSGHENDPNATKCSTLFCPACDTVYARRTVGT